MILDRKLNFGILVSADISTDGLISANVYDAGESKVLFDTDEYKLVFRVAVSQCSKLVLTLLGDTTAATLATGGTATEVIASGTFTVDEAGTALADDATERYVRGIIPIPKQNLAMRYYGLFAVGTGTTANLVDSGSQFNDAQVAGDAHVVLDAADNLLWKRAAVPTPPVSYEAN